LKRWQKEQVAPTNDILHKYINKKSNFHSISDSIVTHATEKLNNLTRKCLLFLPTDEAWLIHSNSYVALHT